VNRHLGFIAGPAAALTILLIGCAGRDADVRRQELRAKLTQSSVASRRIYPYSLIPGGVAGEAEFRAHRRADPALTAHYQGIGDRLLPITIPADRWMFASYRIENAIYWTKRPLLLRAGEPVLTDGVNLVRGRCGNRLSDTPQQPVRRFEPPGLTAETPPDKPIVITETPPLAPVPGRPVRLPGLTPPLPVAPLLPTGPIERPPEQPPVITETSLFPPTTAPPGVLFPIPRESPEINKPLPRVWGPSPRPVAAIPEPATWVLLSLGLGLMSLRALFQLFRQFLRNRSAATVE
jgi:hypothetical protein